MITCLIEKDFTIPNGYILISISTNLLIKNKTDNNSVPLQFKLYFFDDILFNCDVPNYDDLGIFLRVDYGK